MRQHKRRRADTLTEEELDLAVAAGEPLLRSSFAAGLDGLAEFHSYQEEWLASWQLPSGWREKLELDGASRKADRGGARFGRGCWKAEAADCVCCRFGRLT